MTKLHQQAHSEATVGFDTPGNIPENGLAQPQSTNNRWANRRTRRLPAVLLTPSSSTQIAANVLDSSSTGLQLETRDGSSFSRLPKQFSVYIPLENIQYACEIAWSNGNHAGVRFTAAAQMVAKPTPRRVEKQEAPKKGIFGSIFGKKQ